MMLISTMELKFELTFEDHEDRKLLKKFIRIKKCHHFEDHEDRKSLKKSIKVNNVIIIMSLKTMKIGSCQCLINVVIYEPDFDYVIEISKSQLKKLVRLRK